MKLAWIIAFAAACGPAPAPAPAPATALSNTADPTPAIAKDGAQYVGNPEASVVLTYWFDYQCPPCLYRSPVLDAIAREYGDRIVIHYKNFPLEKHPDARRAAIAAEAARRQDRFVDMYHLLVQRSPALSAPDLRTYAGNLALDLDQYDRDINDPAAADAVDREIAEGNRLGLQYVPVLRINGVEYTGDLELSALSAAIEAKLR